MWFTQNGGKCLICPAAITFFLTLPKGPGGMFWAVVAHFGPPGTPRKNAFFQERGRKRMKELGEVTFMKEGMKALSVGFVLPLTHLQNLVSFPRYGHLKITKSWLLLTACPFWTSFHCAFLMEQISCADVWVKS